MNRIKEYLGFAVGFAGLGYMALWPIASVDASGEPFGAGLICGGDGLFLLNYFCHVPHPVELPSTLHALGCLSALVVAVRLPVQAFRRSRRSRRNAEAQDVSLARIAAAQTMKPSARKPAYRLRTVKPRAQFGLRGTPR